jgi:hypothetical protein
MNKNKGGRPPNPSTPQIKARICLEIAEGKSLRNICLADDMPASETVRVWLAIDAEFAAQYARAREEQAD